MLFCNIYFPAILLVDPPPSLSINILIYFPRETVPKENHVDEDNGADEYTPILRDFRLLLKPIHHNKIKQK